MPSVRLQLLLKQIYYIREDKECKEKYDFFKNDPKGSGLKGGYHFICSQKENEERKV